VSRISAIDRNESFIRYGPTAKDTPPLFDLADRTAHREQFRAVGRPAVGPLVPVAPDRAGMQTSEGGFRHRGHMLRLETRLSTADFLEFC
jgi:hypothetical protein